MHQFGHGTNAVEYGANNLQAGAAKGMALQFGHGTNAVEYQSQNVLSNTHCFRLQFGHGTNAV